MHNACQRARHSRRLVRMLLRKLRLPIGSIGCIMTRSATSSLESPGSLGVRRHSAFILILAIVLRASAAYAIGQVPLISEDPSSPCASSLDVPIAYESDFVGPGHDQLGQQEFRSHVDMSVPFVQLNYGLTDRIQARLEGQVPLTTVAPSNGGLSVGFGDVSTGLKYRFMDQIDGLEYSDTCDPEQSEAAWGVTGPFSISIFPQLTFPTGDDKLGLGSGEYFAELPVDVARKIGKLYLVGEFSFVWAYHDKSSPNELALGLAAYYSLTPKLDLLGEQRINFLTAGRGPTLWLMNVGAQYEINDTFAVFFSTGTSVAATSSVAPTNLSVIIGTEITLPFSH